jgi:hypothetical protein
MKLWTDVSVVLKIVFVCLIVGFVLGICLSGAPLFTAPSPSPSSKSNVVDHAAVPSQNGLGCEVTASPTGTLA